MTFQRFSRSKIKNPFVSISINPRSPQIVFSKRAIEKFDIQRGQYVDLLYSPEKKVIGVEIFQGSAQVDGLIPLTFSRQVSSSARITCGSFFKLYGIEFKKQAHKLPLVSEEKGNSLILYFDIGHVIKKAIKNAE